MKSPKRNGRASRSPGVIRRLDPDDPRNPDHPSHRQQWLELAQALGRLEAREEYERLHGNTESKSDVRKPKTCDHT